MLLAVSLKWQDFAWNIFKLMVAFLNCWLNIKFSHTSCKTNRKRNIRVFSDRLVTDYYAHEVQKWLGQFYITCCWSKASFCRLALTLRIHTKAKKTCSTIMSYVSHGVNRWASGIQDRLPWFFATWNSVIHLMLNYSFNHSFIYTVCLCSLFPFSPWVEKI